MSIPEIETEGSKVLVTFFWTLLPKSWRSQTLATERYLKRCVRFFIGLSIYDLGFFFQEDDTLVPVACCASQTPRIATSINFILHPFKIYFVCNSSFLQYQSDPFASQYTQSWWASETSLCGMLIYLYLKVLCYDDNYCRDAALH